MRTSISNVLADVVALVAAAMAVGLAGACSDYPVDPIAHGSCVQDPQASFPLAQEPNDDVDILLVIDDSASMADEQETLAANLARLIDVLERPEVAVDYRIGIVTTNHGNPLCESTTPEEGALQLRSCRAHLEDFVGEGDGSPLTDATEVCTAACPEPWAEITTLATATDDDASPRPRPWIERTAGHTNLPAGLDSAQALQCLGLQGIGGCAFESPLEALRKAVERSFTDGDPAFGFIRDHASLLVVLVTDEDDCSHHPDWESMFLPEGDRTFWSDPSAPMATSAVCWNAAVACTGLADGRYEECHAVDRDADGNPVAQDDADALAVLRPLSRYEDLLQEIEDRKRQLFPDQEVRVSLLAGVNSDGSVTYDDPGLDPAFEQEYGIGPGCLSQSGRATPPVRLRELAEAFQDGEDRSAYSIYDDDYTPVLEVLAGSLAAQVRPACVPACVADTDPFTPDVLDPSCVLTQDVPDHFEAFDDEVVPPCEANAALPSGHDVCHVPLLGEDRSDFCQDHGYNLEFQLVRREGVWVPPGTTIEATCALSTCTTTDCPDLLEGSP
jgi:hypothetical protein